MTAYQVFLLVVLIAWPLAIIGLLFLMSRLEGYVRTTEAETPQEAGLEPVAGQTREKEVRIFVGEEAVGGGK